jgi:hypothetical protein
MLCQQLDCSSHLGLLGSAGGLIFDLIHLLCIKQTRYERVHFISHQLIPCLHLGVSLCGF